MPTRHVLRGRQHGPRSRQAHAPTAPVAPVKIDLNVGKGKIDGGNNPELQALLGDAAAAPQPGGWHKPAPIPEQEPPPMPNAREPQGVAESSVRPMVGPNQSKQSLLDKFERLPLEKKKELYEAEMKRRREQREKDTLAPASQDASQPQQNAGRPNAPPHLNVHTGHVVGQSSQVGVPSTARRRLITSNETDVQLSAKRNMQEQQKHQLDEQMRLAKAIKEQQSAESNAEEFSRHRSNQKSTSPIRPSAISASERHQQTHLGDEPMPFMGALANLHGGLTAAQKSERDRKRQEFLDGLATQIKEKEVRKHKERQEMERREAKFRREVASMQMEQQPRAMSNAVDQNYPHLHGIAPSGRVEDPPINYVSPARHHQQQQPNTSQHHAQQNHEHDQQNPKSHELHAMEQQAVTSIRSSIKLSPQRSQHPSFAPGIASALGFGSEAIQHQNRRSHEHVTNDAVAQNQEKWQREPSIRETGDGAPFMSALASLHGGPTQKQQDARRAQQEQMRRDWAEQIKHKESQKYKSSKQYRPKHGNGAQNHDGDIMNVQHQSAGNVNNSLAEASNMRQHSSQQNYVAVAHQAEKQLQQPMSNSAMNLQLPPAQYPAANNSQQGWNAQHQNPHSNQQTAPNAPLQSQHHPMHQYSQPVSQLTLGQPTQGNFSQSGQPHQIQTHQNASVPIAGQMEGQQQPLIQQLIHATQELRNDHAEMRAFLAQQQHGGLAPMQQQVGQQQFVQQPFLQQEGQIAPQISNMAPQGLIMSSNAAVNCSNPSNMQVQNSAMELGPAPVGTAVIVDDAAQGEWESAPAQPIPEEKQALPDGSRPLSSRKQSDSPKKEKLPPVSKIVRRVVKKPEVPRKVTESEKPARRAMRAAPVQKFPLRKVVVRKDEKDVRSAPARADRERGSKQAGRAAGAVNWEGHSVPGSRIPKAGRRAGPTGPKQNDANSFNQNQRPLRQVVSASNDSELLNGSSVEDGLLREQTSQFVFFAGPDSNSAQPQAGHRIATAPLSGTHPDPLDAFVQQHLRVR